MFERKTGLAMTSPADAYSVSTSTSSSTLADNPSNRKKHKELATPHKARRRTLRSVDGTVVGDRYRYYNGPTKRAGNVVITAHASEHEHEEHGDESQMSGSFLDCRHWPSEGLSELHRSKNNTRAISAEQTISRSIAQGQRVRQSFSAHFVLH